VVVVEAQALRWVEEVEWAQVCDDHSVCTKAMDELGTHISVEDTFRILQQGRLVAENKDLDNGRGEFYLLAFTLYIIHFTLRQSRYFVDIFLCHVSKILKVYKHGSAAAGGCYRRALFNLACVFECKGRIKK